jgi:hypothetical protein
MIGITGTWNRLAASITCAFGAPDALPSASTRYQVGTSMSIFAACCRKDWIPAASAVR